MKYKLNILYILIILIVVLSCISTYAHSGGTDSKGGHWDSSTGEYHYHHGYSAHDHYDIDGDGKKDCPYNFKNNEKDQSSPSQSIQQLPDDKSSKRSIGSWIELILFSLIITVCSILCFGYIIVGIINIPISFLFRKIFKTKDSNENIPILISLAICTVAIFWICITHVDI